MVEGKIGQPGSQESFEQQATVGESQPYTPEFHEPTIQQEALPQASPVEPITVTSEQNHNSDLDVDDVISNDDLTAVDRQGIMARGVFEETAKHIDTNEIENAA